MTFEQNPSLDLQSTCGFDSVWHGHSAYTAGVTRKDKMFLSHMAHFMCN